MNRTGLYLVVGLLAVGVAFIGYMYYQEKRSGIDIKISKEGVSIDGK